MMQNSIENISNNYNRQKVFIFSTLASLIVILIALMIFLVIHPNTPTRDNGNSLISIITPTPSSISTTTQATIATPTTTAIPTLTTKPIIKAVVDPNKCKEIVANYYKCIKDGDYGYVIGPNSIVISYTSNDKDDASDYSISPNKEWMYVIPASASQVKDPVDPGENAIYMIDLKNTKAYTLFSEIGLIAADNAWSSEGNGFTFTAGADDNTSPNIIKTNYHAVLYCTTTCNVLATNAGPEPGITADPSHFVNGQIVYTDINGKQVSVKYK